MDIKKNSKKTEAIDVNQSINNLINKAIEIVSKPDEANEKKIVEFRDALESLKPIDKTAPYEILPDTQEKLKNLFNIDVSTEKTSKDSKRINETKKADKKEKKLDTPKDVKEKYNSYINSQIDDTVKAINNILEVPKRNEKGESDLEYNTEEVGKVANNLLTGLLQHKLKSFTDINLGGSTKTNKEASEIDINTLNYRYDDGWFDRSDESIEATSKRTHEIDNINKSQKETVATSYDTAEINKEVHKIGKIPDLSYKKKSTVDEENLVRTEKGKQHIDEEVDKTSKELKEVSEEAIKTNKALTEVDSEADKTPKKLENIEDASKTSKDLSNISTEIEDTEKSTRLVEQSSTSTNKNLESIDTSTTDNEKELNVIEDETVDVNKNKEDVDTSIDKNQKETTDVNVKNTTTDKERHELDYTTLTDESKELNSVETYNLTDTEKELNSVDTDTNESEKQQQEIETDTAESNKVTNDLTEYSASFNDLTKSDKENNDFSANLSGLEEIEKDSEVVGTSADKESKSTEDVSYDVSSTNKDINQLSTTSEKPEKEKKSVNQIKPNEIIDKSNRDISVEAVNSQLDGINDFLGLPEGEGFSGPQFQNTIGSIVQFFSTNSTELVRYANKAKRSFNTQVNAEQLTNFGTTSASTVFTGELSSRSISDIMNDMGEKETLTEIQKSVAGTAGQTSEDLVEAIEKEENKLRKTTENNSTDTVGQNIQEAYESEWKWASKENSEEDLEVPDPKKRDGRDFVKDEEELPGPDDDSKELKNTLDQLGIGKATPTGSEGISEAAAVSKSKVDDQDEQVQSEISKLIKDSIKEARAKQKGKSGRKDARKDQVKSIDIPAREDGVDETIKGTRDLGKLGFLKIYTRRALNYNETMENGGVYKIPFQFEPEISGDAKAADYGAISTLARSQSTQVYRRSTERSISLNLHYLVTGSEENNSESLSAEGMNGWTENYIYNEVLVNLKNLVLPNIGESLAYRLAPPIVQVWYGDIKGTSASSTNSRDFHNINPVFKTTWYSSDGQFRTMRSLWVCKNVSFEYKGGYVNSESRRTVWVTAQLELTEIAPNAAANELMIWRSLSA
jgi:hypothetical protein